MLVLTWDGNCKSFFYKFCSKIMLLILSKKNLLRTHSTSAFPVNPGGQLHTFRWRVGVHAETMCKLFYYLFQSLTYFCSIFSPAFKPQAPGASQALRHWLRTHTSEALQSVSAAHGGLQICPSQNVLEPQSALDLHAFGLGRHPWIKSFGFPWYSSRHKQTPSVPLARHSAF